MTTTGAKDIGHYRGVATNQEFYFSAVGTKVGGHYREVVTHQGWQLRGVPLHVLVLVYFCANLKIYHCTLDSTLILKNVHTCVQHALRQVKA